MEASEFSWGIKNQIRRALPISQFGIKGFFPCEFWDENDRLLDVKISLCSKFLPETKQELLLSCSQFFVIRCTRKCSKIEIWPTLVFAIFAKFIPNSPFPCRNVCSHNHSRKNIHYLEFRGLDQFSDSDPISIFPVLNQTNACILERRERKKKV